MIPLLERRHRHRNTMLLTWITAYYALPYKCDTHRLYHFSAQLHSSRVRKRPNEGKEEKNVCALFHVI